MRPTVFALAILPLVIGACAAPAQQVVPCRNNCNSHEEGYQWAWRGNLLDDRACAGYSEAFSSGCRDGVHDLQQLRPAQEGL
ncbi:MAG: hypothetical protein PHP86_11890 [Nevskiales bacterium]|nr:hypothetical protein [Nevskiales bacterium]